MTAPRNLVFSDEPTFYQKESYTDKYRTDILSAEDWLGNRFAIGDTVMYCIGAGHGQMMALGVVQQIRAIERQRLRSWEWQDEPNGYKRRINEVWDNYWDAEVQVLTTRTSGSYGNKQRTRPAWVNPMNITAVKGVQLA